MSTLTHAFSMNWLTHVHECCARDFEYSQYKSMAEADHIHVVTEATYKLFHAAFEQDMEEHIGTGRITLQDAVSALN